MGALEDSRRENEKRSRIMAGDHSDDDPERDTTTPRQDEPDGA